MVGDGAGDGAGDDRHGKSVVPCSTGSRSEMILEVVYTLLERKVCFEMTLKCVNGV
jgi:hypothetical protein